MTHVTTSTKADLSGRDPAPMVSVMSMLVAGASLIIGLPLLLGGLVASGFGWFAWPIASPVTAGLLGAGFVGAAPMLFHTSTRHLWEFVRVPYSAATVVLVGASAVTVTDIDHVFSGDGLVSTGFALAWTAGILALTAGVLLSLIGQVREPGLPLARTAAVPHWTRPLIGLIGSAFAGLGAGRSEERRVGKECRRLCRSRWSPYH
jgi:hypothetical protein